jgi:hypothetical protein
MGPFSIQPMFLMLEQIWSDNAGGSLGLSLLTKNSGVWCFYVSQQTGWHAMKKKTHKNHPLQPSINPNPNPNHNPNPMQYQLQ